MYIGTLLKNNYKYQKFSIYYQKKYYLSVNDYHFMADFFLFLHTVCVNV